MSENIKNQSKDIYDSLMGDHGRLMGYQKASVEEIVSHFQNENKSLLADEVGLGKTEIAKGVVASLVKKHCDGNNNRPYRVAYICPNANVAVQNYRKLQIYNKPATNKLNGLEDIVRPLRDILNEYHNVDDIQKGYKNLRNLLIEKSVYTRVWDWLLAICDPNMSLETEMGDYFLVLQGEKLSMSSEWKKDNNRLLLNEETKGHIIKLYKCGMELLKNSNNESINKFYYEYCINWGKYVSNGLSAENIFAFNKAIARYLIFGQGDLQYRISMLHLCEAESSFYSEGTPMVLESLTPETSFKKDTSGNVIERALAGATYDILCDKEVFSVDPRKKDNTDPYTQSYQDYYGFFCNKIRAYKETDVLKKIKETLKNIATTSLGSNEESIKMVRNVLIDFNLKNINYDFVILDEFQNYRDLLDKSTGIGIIAEKLFNSSAKTLLLSATPFAISDYIPGFMNDDEECGEEENIDDSLTRSIHSEDEALEDFYELIKFMLQGIDFEDWKQRWESAVQNGENDALRKLMMKEAGIIRTERLAATKHEPVKRKLTQIENYNFRYILLANKEAKKNEFNGWKSDYAVSTPYAMSFSYPYQLKKSYQLIENDTAKKDYYNGMSESLFINKDDFENGNLNTEAFAKYQECEKIIFEKDIHKLLWIPPCNCTEPLSGPFEGKWGISKTLIFARYRMTPMALTYLFGYKANNNIGELIDDSINEKELKECIEQYIPNDITGKIRTAISDYLYSLFNSDYGRRVVRLSFSDGNYIKSVENYCKAGCLKDVIKEYSELLMDEYNSNESYIANVFKDIEHCLNPDNAKSNLMLWDNGLVKKNQSAVMSPIAIGLYSEKPSDAARRLKKIKAAFNSPFLPFVFSTTSIGTEGIDLHWYARNIIHWSIPKKPVDLEQREGRVLRYKCHTVRLNKQLLEAQNIDVKDCISEGWEDSGMYNTQLNFFSDNEYDGKDGCFHINSLFISEKESKEALLYDKYMKVVETYRNMLGVSKKSNGAEELNLSPWL